MSPYNQLKEALETQIELSHLASQYLPINEESPSRIRFQLILVIAQFEFSSNNLTVKSLFASIPHSDTAVRKHFDAMLAENWISLENDDHDRRIRYVRATKQLQISITNWLTACDAVFSSLKGNP